MMLHIAVTAPVNPPSASPVLTHAQCWAGLQEKCRRPQDFIAPVTACEVLEERPDGMTRRITHKNWMGMPSGQATQTIDFSGNLKAEFKSVGRTSSVTNLITVGATDTELYLTFTFSNDIPGLRDGSPTTKAKADDIRANGLKAVLSTIAEIRQMVVEGRV